MKVYAAKVESKNRNIKNAIKKSNINKSPKCAQAWLIRTFQQVWSGMVRNIPSLAALVRFHLVYAKRIVKNRDSKGQTSMFTTSLHKGNIFCSMNYTVLKTFL